MLSKVNILKTIFDDLQPSLPGIYYFVNIVMTLVTFEALFTRTDTEIRPFQVLTLC